MTRIAVPSREGMVDEHFGHCAYFTVFTIAGDNTVTAEERFTPPAACGCKSNLAATLKDMGVTALIAGNMGDGALMRLAQSGIKAVRGAKGDVRAALSAYLSGALRDTDIGCASHGHECLHELDPLRKLS